MPTNFLELSKFVTTEVASGRCSVKKGKLLLKINSDIVVNNSIKERLKLWENVVSSRDVVFDYKEEKVIYNNGNESSHFRKFR